MPLKTDLNGFLISESSRSFKFSVQYSGKFEVSIDFQTKKLTIQKFIPATNTFVTVQEREIDNPDFDHSRATEELIKYLEKDML